MIGGLGTEVAEILLEERFAGRFLKIGLPDAYCTIRSVPPAMGSHCPGSRASSDKTAERLLGACS